MARGWVLILALVASSALGAPVGPVYVDNGTPSGACAGARNRIKSSDGAIYCCIASTWTACGTSASHQHSASDITSGTLAGARGGVGVTLPTCTGTDKLTSNGTQVECDTDQTSGDSIFAENHITEKLTLNQTATTVVSASCPNGSHVVWTCAMDLSRVNTIVSENVYAGVTMSGTGEFWGKVTGIESGGGWNAFEDWFRVGEEAAVLSGTGVAVSTFRFDGGAVCTSDGTVTLTLRRSGSAAASLHSASCLWRTITRYP